jgi:hypothetical protein
LVAMPRSAIQTHSSVPCRASWSCVLHDKLVESAVKAIRVLDRKQLACASRQVGFDRCLVQRVRFVHLRYVVEWDLVRRRLLHSRGGSRQSHNQSNQYLIAIGSVITRVAA